MSTINAIHCIRPFVWPISPQALISLLKYGNKPILIRWPLQCIIVSSLIPLVFNKCQYKPALLTHPICGLYLRVTSWTSYFSTNYKHTFTSHDIPKPFIQSQTYIAILNVKIGPSELDDPIKVLMSSLYLILMLSNSLFSFTVISSIIK